MGLKAFLRQNVKPAENIKVVVSKRFIGEDGLPEPWELRVIGESEHVLLKDSCFSKSVGQGGVVHSQFDGQLYNKQLVVASVVYPDLKDAALQKSYGVAAEIPLLDELLISGEYTQLQEAVLSINGFDAEKLIQAKKEVKNS